MSWWIVLGGCFVAAGVLWAFGRRWIRDRVLAAGGTHGMLLSELVGETKKEGSFDPDLARVLFSPETDSNGAKWFEEGSG